MDGKVTHLRSGTLIRCHFEGEADLHERDAAGGYFAHNFTKRECGGQYPSNGCIAGLHATYHCGEDEQWSVFSRGLDGRSAPSVTWFNYKPCQKGIARITANFFCPSISGQVHLYHCRLSGEAKRAPGPDGKQPEICTGPGKYQHQFTNKECTRGVPSRARGLPPIGKPCVASLTRAEHCGGDHDWAVGNNTAASPPSMSWFTSHDCEKARVGADFLCSNDVPTRLHRCSFTGWPRDDPNCVGAQVRHANYPQAGKCLMHKFSEKECTNGLPPRDRACFVALKEAKQCGQEQDFRALSPHDDGMAALRWWNSEPCGEARVVVDYFCPV